jgi:hypothetical protein
LLLIGLILAAVGAYVLIATAMAPQVAIADLGIKLTAG